jgi:hypothetical protein
MTIKDSIYGKFIKFASDYRFKGNVTETQKQTIKFFGISIKTKNVFVEREKLYNDFSFTYDNNGVLTWESGHDGGYRPEGYSMYNQKDGELMGKSIRKRLLMLIDDFNEKYPQYKLVILDKKLLIEIK